MIAIITETQKNSLLGQSYVENCFYNPVQDANGNWVISEEEINQSSLEWLKSLPLINFDAPIIENPFV